MSDKLKRGDIFFVNDRSIFSKMIRLVSTGHFGMDVPSHVGIIENPETGDILEAQWGGVRRANIKVYKKSKIWYARMQGNRNIKRGIRWAQSEIGEGYDYKGVIGIWLRSFWRILGKKVYQRMRKVKNYLDSKQDFWCSEYTEHYSMLTGERLCKGLMSQTTPFDQYRSKKLKFLNVKYNRVPSV